MPKLGSKKSRTGCTRCRQRRVKCDEQKPHCSNCTRLNLEESCRYTAASTTERTERERRHTRRAGWSATKTLEYRPLGTPPPAESEQGQSPSMQSTEHSPDTFSVFDMELFHHFLTKTRLTLGGPAFQHHLEILIPKLAFSNMYLFRGLIAMAALDKGFDAEEANRDKYMHKAEQSLQYGYPLLQSLVTNMNTESPESIAIYAGLVAINALAFRAVRFRGLQLDHNALDAFAEVCVLGHGTGTVAGLSRARMEHAYMRSFFQPGIYLDLESESFDTGKPLRISGTNELQSQLTAQLAKVWQLVVVPGNASKSSSHQNIPDPTAPCVSTSIIYSHYIMTLRRIADNVLSEIAPTSAVRDSKGSPVNIYLISWLSQLDNDFVRVFRAREAPALIIVAYYSLLLRKDNWLCGDWRDWILAAIDELELPHPWVEHLQWIKEKAAEVP